MTRSLVLLAVAALVALGLATSASADKPERVPLVLEPLVLEDSCAFPVLLEPTAQNARLTLFPDGRIHINGKLFARLTNLADPDQVLELNTSGPGFITREGAERGAGRGLFLLRPGEAGGPGVNLVTGRVDVIRAANGFISDIDLRGSSVEVCALLAG